MCHRRSDRQNWLRHHEVYLAAKKGSDRAHQITLGQCARLPFNVRWIKGNFIKGPQDSLYQSVRSIWSSKNCGSVKDMAWHISFIANLQIFQHQGRKRVIVTSWGISVITGEANWPPGCTSTPMLHRHPRLRQLRYAKNCISDGHATPQEFLMSKLRKSILGLSKHCEFRRQYQILPFMHSTLTPHIDMPITEWRNTEPLHQPKSYQLGEFSTKELVSPGQPKSKAQWWSHTKVESPGKPRHEA